MEEELQEELNYWIIKLSKFKAKIMAVATEVEKYKSNNDIEVKAYSLRNALNDTNENILALEGDVMDLQNKIDDTYEKVTEL